MKRQFMPTSSLVPNPLNAQIYCGDAEDLIASIREVGILEAIVITSARMIISGHRRHSAAQLLGLPEVPVDVRSFPDEAVALVEFNRYRRKTWTEIYRETAFILPRLQAQAQARKKFGGRQGAVARHGLAQTQVGHTQPPRRALDDLAQLTGVSREKLRKLRHIFAAVEAGNSPSEIIERLDRNDLTVHEAYRRVAKVERLDRRRRQLDADILAGRYNIDDVIRPFDVIQTWKRDQRFGRLNDAAELLDNSYGTPPPQLLANIVHHFTEEGDLICDPMAGRGTMHDIAFYMKRRCASFDLSPSRAFIQQHDLTTGFPHLSEVPKLVFLDAPYGLQRSYSRSPQDLSNAASEKVFLCVLDGVIRSCMAALPSDGILAVLMGNEYRAGENIDRVWETGKLIEKHGRIVRRIHADYPPSHFPDFRVGPALRRRQMLSLIREVFIAASNDVPR